MLDQTPKPFFWSYSRLKAFESCGKKFYHNSIAKDFTEPKSENQTWGDAVHEAMAARVDQFRPLPMGMEQYEAHAQALVATGHAILCEQKLAVTLGPDGTCVPCDYFDKLVPVWCRATLDVVKFFPEIKAARVVDWKTGKRREPIDESQLLVSAMMAFWHWPEIDAVKADFVWLPANRTDTRIYKRDQMRWLWPGLLGRVKRMQQALSVWDFPPNPSGLCKSWCSVTSCPYHGRGSL
jgi:hypothetical protein